MPSFDAILPWVISHSYAFMFLALLVEGPLVTSAASFAAALGYFDISAVLMISFVADLLTDIIYYAIGYKGRLILAEKFGHRLGLSTERMHRIESFLHRHAVKGFIAMKFMPVLPTFALLTMGALHYPLGRFAAIAAAVIVPRTLLFGGIGYYFGYAYEAVAKRVADTQFAFLIVGIFAGIAYAVYRWAVERFNPLPDGEKRNND